MRKKRRLETEEQRNERVEKQTQRRLDGAAMADKAIDTTVRENVELHGP
jgi:hypothetical protein